MLSALPPAAGVLADAEAGSAQVMRRRFQVWMCDPWCRTPWYTSALTGALQKSGQSVRLVCPSYHLEPDYFQSQGLKSRPGVINLAARMGGPSNRLLRAARFIEFGINLSALRALTVFAPPEIVHYQQCVLLERGWKTELGFLRWCRRRGGRVVYTVHNLLPHRKQPFHFSAYAELYRTADALICHDAEAATALRKDFGAQRSRIHVIPHGPLFADPPILSPAQCRHALGISADRQVYLALGVLSPYKGLGLLLEAWKDMVRSSSTTSKPLLVIAGDGPEEEKARLQHARAKLGIEETVRLDLVYVPAVRVPMYLQSADVLLYPYREITTSGALLTGLNYRKPIIASDLIPFRNYLDPNVNALIVPVGDRAALTGAMGRLQDPAVLGRIRAGSRKNDKLQVQWSEIAARTVDVYRNVLR